jgi:GNAT superfamily N-acetyltransferase
MPRGGSSGVIRTVDVVVTYLARDLVPELSAPARPAVPLPGAASARFELHRVPASEAGATAAMLYRAVGAAWHWSDRLPWQAAEWESALNRADAELWITRVDGEIAGYFELSIGDDAVELSYLGLLPEFTGRRLGGLLLAAAIDRATALGKGRMTVNTCTLDHPAALPNYLKRGFSIVRTVTQRRVIAS